MFQLWLIDDDLGPIPSSEEYLALSQGHYISLLETHHLGRDPYREIALREAGNFPCMCKAHMVSLP